MLDAGVRSVSFDFAGSTRERRLAASMKRSRSEDHAASTAASRMLRKMSIARRRIQIACAREGRTGAPFAHCTRQRDASGLAAIDFGGLLSGEVVQVDQATLDCIDGGLSTIPRSHLLK